MRKNKTDDGCMLPLQSSGATVWYGNDGPTDHDPSGTSVTSLLVSVRLSPAAAALEKKNALLLRHWPLLGDWVLSGPRENPWAKV